MTLKSSGSIDLRWRWRSDRPTLKSLYQVREGRLRRLQLDYSRRGLTSGVLPEGSVFDKLRMAFQGFHQHLGDQKVAESCNAYETYPKGSLGRTFFDFFRARNFPLPGEKGSFSEFAVPHDLSYILGGFNSDMSGGIDVAGMQAGMAGTSFGYEMLLEVILIFHMGLKFTTLGVLDPGEGNFHPDCFALGFERGQGMNVNLLRGWGWLRAMGEPLSDLRAEYQIEAVPVIDMPAPKEH